MPFNMSDECSPPREKVQFYEPSSKERKFRVQNLLLCSGEKPALAVSPGPNVGQHGGNRNSGDFGHSVQPGLYYAELL